MSNCRSCGAEIKWIKTKAGKDMPVNAKAMTVVSEEGEVITNVRLSHFSSCPQANQWRKNGNKRGI